MPKAEGRVYPFVGEEYIQADLLEVIQFDRPDELITIETNEFTAVCPFSGLPDIGYLKIEYYPEGGKIVELKSLKYYLISFRNVGVYQERACQIIYETLKRLLSTERIRVTLEYNIRGGIKTTTVLGNL